MSPETPVNLDVLYVDCRTTAPSLTDPRSASLATPLSLGFSRQLTAPVNAQLGAARLEGKRPRCVTDAAFADTESRVQTSGR